MFHWQRHGTEHRESRARWQREFPLPSIRHGFWFIGAVLIMLILTGGIIGAIFAWHQPRQSGFQWLHLPRGVLSDVFSSTAPLDPSRIAELAKPGTVMIETIYTGTLTVPNFNLSGKGTVLAQSLFKQQQPAMAMQSLLQNVANDPMDLLAPSGGEPQTIKGGAQGSGFIVTPDGYMVTNAHVVKVEDALKQQAAVQAANNAAQGVGGQYQRNYGVALSQDLFTSLAYAFYNFYQQTITVNLSDKRIYSALGAAVPGLVTVQKGFSSTLVTAGDPIPGKDVAILKMEGTNLPTLPLGDETTLATGDRIYVMGYPAAATFHPLAEAQQSATVPTLTSGVVSAMRPMTGGWSAIQTDAAFTHGNSGGPALDSSGRVIGIATFGSTDPMTGETVAGMNFIVPMSIVREFLNQSNVQPQEGIFTSLYTRALDQYGRQHFKESLNTFQQINAISPGNPYVQDYISTSQAAIAENRDRSWEDPLRTGLYIGGGALILLGLLAWFVRRGRPSKLRLAPRKPLQLGEQPAGEQQERPGEQAA